MPVLPLKKPSRLETAFLIAPHNGLLANLIEPDRALPRPQAAGCIEQHLPATFGLSPTGLELTVGSRCDVPTGHTGKSNGQRAGDISLKFGFEQECFYTVLLASTLAAERPT